MTDQKVQTAFGEADIPALVRAYESMKKHDEKKKAWLKTDRGKEWNREKASAYYEKHKEEVLEKRRVMYEQNRDIILARAKAYYLKKKAAETPETSA